MERVNIDKVYHPFLTGPFNKLVGEMMQETGARINVPPPSVNKTEIVITGEKEQVALAVTLIKKVYEEKVIEIQTIARKAKNDRSHQFPARLTLFLSFFLHRRRRAPPPLQWR